MENSQNNTSQNTDIWAKLRTQLKDTQEFPLLYMFKFICPSDNQTIAKLSSFFPETAIISLKSSQKGNFTSFTAKEVMMSPEEIIGVYDQATKIKGVIML